MTVTTTVQGAADAAASRPSRIGATRFAGLLGSAAAAAALLLAFPPYDLWWLAPVGVALLDLVTRGRRVLPAALYGLLCGALFFGVLLRWTNLHVGPTPWLVLTGFQATYLGLLGAAAGFAGPLVARWRWSAPLVTALLWTAQEALRGRAPFGGFPWGRLAFSQSDSPLLPLAALGGAPLVTFAVGLVGGLLAVAVRATLGVWRTTGDPGPRSARFAAAGAALVGAAALLAAGALVRPAPPSGARVTVAIVQGNVPRLGLDFNAQRRAVLDNHVTATIELSRRVAAGTVPRPDLVVWPENSSDIDPLVNDDAAERITVAADAIGAPILVGAVLDGPGVNYRNAALVWLPGTRPGGTPAGLYVKRHPVPFAEYIPLRPLARRVSSAVDLVRADFVGGTRPGVLRLGPATVGDVICFEIAYDGLVRDTVTGGAQLLTVQTNNATFDSAEALQQLAMVRLRAVEHGRDALMVSTVGISGFVTANGIVHGATGFDVPAVEVRVLTLGSGRTLATRLGAGPEYLIVTAALATLVLAGALRGAARKSRAARKRRPIRKRSTAISGVPDETVPDKEDL